MLSLLLPSLIVSLVINLVMFLIASRYKSDKLTDISYALSFLALALLTLLHHISNAKFAAILIIMVCLWAGRLGSYLLARVIRVGKDRRFDDVRNSFSKFGRFWLGQAITAWLLMIPVTLAVRRGAKTDGLVIVGLVIWLIGFLFEVTADYQKNKFKRDSSNKGKWIETGVWRYSRHPNYFGEILVWFGIYIYAYNALDSTQSLVSLISPVLITFLLVFISGIPPLEKSADTRWGKLSSYKKYKDSTSILIPLPKLKG